MPNRKGAIPKVPKEPFRRSEKTTRTPPNTTETPNQGVVSIYLCQICSVEDDMEKVRCDECMLWFHFSCVNVTGDVMNQDLWICTNCESEVSQRHPVSVPTGTLVDIETDKLANYSKLPPNQDLVFESHSTVVIPSRSSISKSNKSMSVKSTISRRATLALQKLEEERELLEKRENEARERERERDKEYLKLKYSILEDDVMSNLSFDDEELNLVKCDSTRRWTENIPPNENLVVQLNDEILIEGVNRCTTPPQDSTQADRQSSGNIVISTANQTETNDSHTVTNDDATIPIKDQVVSTEMSSQSRASMVDPRISQLHRLNVPNWLINPKLTTKPIPHPWEHTLHSRPSMISNLPPDVHRQRVISQVPSQVHSTAVPSVLNAPCVSVRQPNGRSTANQSNTVPNVTEIASNCATTGYGHTLSNPMTLQQPTPSYQSTTLQHPHLSSTFTLRSSTQCMSSSNAIQTVASNYAATMNYQPAWSIIQPVSSVNQPGSSLRQSNGCSSQTVGQIYTSNCQTNGQSYQVFSSHNIPMMNPTSLVNNQPVNSQPVYQPQFNPLVTSHPPYGSTTYHQHPLASVNNTFVPISQPITVHQQPNMNGGMNQGYNTGSFGASANISIPSRLTAEQIAARHVMPRDLPQFGGDPTEWESFISAYDNANETCGFTNSENLGRLQKCLKDKAKTAVKSRLIHKDSVPGVIHTLRMLFGRPELIIEAMIQDIQKIPPPKDDCLSSLITFAIAVQNLSASIQNTGALEHLRNPMLINSITDKLPAHLQLNWAFHKNSIGNANIAHLGDWLYQLADVASQVVRVSSKSSQKKSATTTNTISNSSKEANPFINSQVENTSKTSNSKDEKSKSCPACNNSSCAKLATCKKFKEISRLERWTIVKNNFLCGRCFGRHKFYRCSSDTKCTVNGCNSNHHTLLHNYDLSSEAKPNGEMKSNTVAQSSHVRPANALDNNTNGSDKTTCNSQRSNIAQRSDKFRIVPVMLHFRNKSVRDYAYLDDGSNMTTMEDSLADELELTGSLKELCVDWAFGETHSAMDSRIVSVGISGYYDNAPRFKMSNVRTVKHLHLPTQSITTSWIDQYPHFKNVPIATYESVKPRLLIGLQYSKLIVSLETIEGRENEPIVCRTRLGWVVQGPTYEKDCSPNKQKFSINMCICQSNDNELHQLVKDYFAMENLGVKIPEKFLESKELERANKILESTTVKKHNRYESGLLWKNDDVELPRSYGMALKRLKCLESTMSKNPDLRANLSKQIHQFIEKGYIRKLSTDEINNCKHRVWYLPTFPVFNPKKPRLRIVYLFLEI